MILAAKAIKIMLVILYVNRKEGDFWVYFIDTLIVTSYVWVFDD